MRIGFSVLLCLTKRVIIGLQTKIRDELPPKQVRHVEVEVGTSLENRYGIQLEAFMINVLINEEISVIVQILETDKIESRGR